jgi:hypothetical protein
MGPTRNEKTVAERPVNGTKQSGQQHTLLTSIPVLLQWQLGAIENIDRTDSDTRREMETE